MKNQSVKKSKVVLQVKLLLLTERPNVVSRGVRVKLAEMY